MAQFDPSGELSDTQQRSLVIIKPPVMASEGLTQLALDPGEQTTVTCTASNAYPAPELRWNLAGAPVASMQPEEVTCNGHLCTAQLQYTYQAKEEDHGKALQCVSAQKDSFHGSQEVGADPIQIVINGVSGGGGGSSDALSTGAIVGISLGSALLVLLLILLLFYCLGCCCFTGRKNKKDRSDQPRTTTVPQNQGRKKARVGERIVRS